MQPESRKALVIGINDYDNPKAQLRSSENDAIQIHRLLSTHEDGSANFNAHRKLNPTCRALRMHIQRLLQPQRSVSEALLYFSGHGYVDTSGGYLVGKDYQKEDMGVSMDWLIAQIEASRIGSITLVFDCCYAASFGQLKSEGRPLASLPENVTLLAAVRSDDVAQEGPEHGKFTQILIQGLEGASADALGRVTAASLYSMADTVLTPWQQRPVFKSYVNQMQPLRRCAPTVDRALLQALDGYDFFHDRRRKKQLQPSDVCVDSNKYKSVIRFAQLMAFQRAGLIRCINDLTVYEAALQNQTCELTPMGHFFLELLDKNRI